MDESVVGVRVIAVALFQAHIAVTLLLNLVGGHGSVAIDAFFLVLIAFMGSYTGLRIHLLQQRLRELNSPQS